MIDLLAWYTVTSTTAEAPASKSTTGEAFWGAP